jgi:hypothetical protein|tara:strand:- start:2394 stop:2969 length:576 start_codon:yes stop_codon:yes gene_type:complete
LKNSPNKRHQKRAIWALDSQQVARVCGGRYKLPRNIMYRTFLLILIAFPVACWASAKNVPIGTWQPSYAFLGKMPWDKNYLIIKDDAVIIETSGVAKESFTYKVIKDSSVPAIQLSNSKIWKFEINPKFGCKPKPKLSYDKECTGQHQRQMFRLLQCESIESPIDACSILDAYFSFDKRELVSLEDQSKNL